MKSSKLRDITSTLAKIMEIFAWVMDGLCVLGIVVCIFFGNKITEAYSQASDLGYLTVNGIESHELSQITPDNIIPLLIAAWITGLVILTLTGIIFRNIHLVFKKANTDSPFAESNVKLIKQIGYAALAIPVCKIIANIALGFIAKDMTIGVELSEVLFGLVILCLAQYFAYGASLEKDVNGLL